MILVTGFEPFAGDSVNPSQLLVERLDGLTLGESRVKTVVLPVSATRAPAALAAAIERHRPNVVVAFGLAGGRSSISLERVGINVLDSRIPDNDGVQAIDEPVVHGGPAAHLATLPLRAILAAWQEAQIPAELSNSAGTFICNQILYTALALGAAHGHSAGFIHLPYLPEQAARQPPSAPSMTLELMLAAAEIAITAAARMRVPA